MKPERMKGVIFDLDGVLCSTDEYHYRAWKALADSLGIPFDRTINSRLRGVSREESLEIILERAGRHYSAEEKREMCREKNELYRTFLSALSVEDLAPGAAKMLHELRRAGKKLAVGSSSRNAQVILEKLGIAGLFDAVADGNRIRRSKPDPEVFLLAAQLLHLKPEQCIVVEDAYSGIAAAKAGGFYAAAIGDAVTCPPADRRLERLDELVGLLC